MNAMKNFKIALIVVGLFVSTYSNAEIPSVENPHNIIVDGRKITQLEFLQRYCSSTKMKESNETCDKVRHAMSSDSRHGQIPKGW